MSILTRFEYILRAVRYRFGAIRCHWSAYVDRASLLHGRNFVGDRTTILNSELGPYSYVNSACIISNCKVGAYSCIGREVLVGLGAHPTNRLAVHRMFYSKEIAIWRHMFVRADFEEHLSVKIGSDVWVGARSMVLDGVEIGDGAIIAAGSLVTKDVPPFSIVAGAPARVIRQRFGDETIRKIQKDPWWRLSPQEVAEMAQTGAFNTPVGG